MSERGRRRRRGKRKKYTQVVKETERAMQCGAVVCPICEGTGVSKVRPSGDVCIFCFGRGEVKRIGSRIYRNL